MVENNDILDMETLGMLQSLQQPGMPSVLGRIVEAFCRSSATLVDDMVTALAAGNASGVMDAAHSLKSGSANAGAAALSAAAAGAERAARDGDLEGAVVYVEQVKTLFPASATALNALM